MTFHSLVVQSFRWRSLWRRLRLQHNHFRAPSCRQQQPCTEISSILLRDSPKQVIHFLLSLLSRGFPLNCSFLLGRSLLRAFITAFSSLAGGPLPWRSIFDILWVVDGSSELRINDTECFAVSERCEPQSSEERWLLQNIVGVGAVNSGVLAVGASVGAEH